ncbi:MAG: hypothetical protein U9Q67_00995, partial [Patescibacteria group bacterium]|nr:hypothetical protein [Patescibacteria group bacterium]
METILIGLLVFLIIAIIAAAIFISSKISQLKNPEDDKSMLLLQNQINQLTQEMSAKMKDMRDSVQRQYGTNTQMLQKISLDSSKTIREVTEK